MEHLIGSLMAYAEIYANVADPEGLPSAHPWSLSDSLLLFGVSAFYLDAMESPVPGLDNREFALVAWTVAALGASLFSRSLRTSLAGVVRSLIAWKLLVIFGAMGLYVGGLVFVLSVVGLWKQDLVSETAFWYLFSGLVILFRSVGGAGAKDGFFKDTLLSTFAATAWLEFAVNVRPLNLTLELISVPFLVLLFSTLAFSELKLKGSHEAGFLLGAATVVVLFFFGYTLAGMVSDPDAYFTYENLLELLLPILLTVGLVPFVYAAALLATYGGLFSRLNWKLRGQPGIRRYAKRRILRAGHVRLGRAHRLAQKLAWKIAPTDTKLDVDRAVEHVLSSGRAP